MLHDRVHAGHAHRVQPEPGESVPGEPAAGRRDVRGAGDEERGRADGRRGGRPGAGHRYDVVADVRAERAAVSGHAVGGLVERQDRPARALSTAAGVRRTGTERGSAAVRLLV